jgi:hypothetical protein
VSGDLRLGSRKTGRIAAGLAAFGTLALAGFVAVSEIDPILHLYDGLWMFAGASVAFACIAPIVRRWRREPALALIAAGVAVGAWCPLVLLALRAHIPVLARLKGSIFLSSADIIGVALPVGATLAWLALGEHRPVSHPAGQAQA